MTVLLLAILKWFFIIAALLLIAGILYEYWSRWRLEQHVPANRTFVTINNVSLHYVKKGQGNCTVVFQSGMGSSHAIWREIQDSIAPYAVTIAYDRNGLMFSEPANRPVTNNEVTRELEMLLEKTNCPKPYILVGHSMAGIYLRPFIRRHEKDICGILFAEASHPLQKAKASPELIKTLTPPPDWLVRFVIRTGIYRAVFSFMPISPEIPMHHPLHKLERDFFYRSYPTIAEELKDDDLNFKDAAQYASFGDIPLTVMTGASEVRYAGIKDPGIRHEYKNLTTELQHDLLKLSSNSRMVKAKKSGHIVQINDVELVVAEIRSILAAFRPANFVGKPF